MNVIEKQNFALFYKQENSFYNFKLSANHHKRGWTWSIYEKRQNKILRCESKEIQTENPEWIINCIKEVINNISIRYYLSDFKKESF